LRVAAKFLVPADIQIAWPAAMPFPGLLQARPIPVGLAE